MATFTSSLYTQQLQGKAVLPSAAGFTQQVRRAFATVAVTTALAAADVLQFFNVPKNATLVDLALFADDLDSGGPTITLNVGDDAGATSLYNASAIGGTGGVDRSPVRTALGKVYAQDTLVFGTVQAAATAKVAGNVSLLMLYTLDGNAVS